MQKNDFLNELDRYNTDNSKFSKIVLLLKNELKYFKDSYEFNIEGVGRSISIDINNQGDYLFIDLNEQDFNLRFSHSEFYLFINEIDLDLLKLLLENFFKGIYKIIIYLKEDLILKQELYFSNLSLEYYNQTDIYSNKKSNQIFEKNGYNWLANAEIGNMTN